MQLALALCETRAKWNQFDGFKKYAVTASSLDDFLDRYYRHDRYRGRGEQYAASVRKSHTYDLNKFGMDWISGYDSNTGDCVAYYPETNN